MFTVVWGDKALRQLEKITDKKIKNHIFDRVDALRKFPNTSNVVQLSQHHLYDYRLRIGRYRVLFNVTATIKVIAIEEVKKRDEQTY